MNTLYVAGMGVLGVLARYFADSLGARWFPTVPWMTFVVNALGCVIAGVVWTVGAERDLIPVSMRIALLAGFCGGFTTFSAYCLQSLLLIGSGQRLLALAYLGLSPIVGLAAVRLGIALGRVWLK